MVGRGIRTIRRKRKISIDDLSMRTGLSKTSLYAIERNESIPTMKNYNKILDAINTHHDEVLLYSIEDPSIINNFKY